MTASIEQKNPRILLVDDEDDIPLFLRAFASKFNFNLDFVHAKSIDEGVAVINQQCFDAAVIDVCLRGGLTGVSLGELIRRHDADVPLAYLTNLDTDKVRTEAAIQRAMFLSKRLFIGSDEGMRTLLEIIDQMARLNPCAEGDTRVDDDGYRRKLSSTPLEIPGELRALLSYGRMAARAA